MIVDLSIIIVNWNVRDLLRDCLRSIFACAGSHIAENGALYLSDYRAEVWVVDNASTDGSAKMVRAEFPQVNLIASESNLGFSAGNNVALRRCQGRYALLLNPDTRIVGEALTLLLDYAELHPELGVVGPQLRYGDGSLQPSRRRFPTLMTAFLESTILHQWWPRNPWAQRYIMADTPDDMTQEVDWVVGACMLVRREAFQQAGLLDESFFMYSEELDWCRRIVAAGWRVAYLPQAIVLHYEGQSSNQVVAARHIRFESSKIHYFCKHHGAAQAMLLRNFLLLTYLYRLIEEAFKLVLGHKPALRRERIFAYHQVLRSGLRLPSPSATKPKY